jgi:hypothetical protein
MAPDCAIGNDGPGAERSQQLVTPGFGEATQLAAVDPEQASRSAPAPGSCFVAPFLPRPDEPLPRGQQGARVATRQSPCRHTFAASHIAAGTGCPVARLRPSSAPSLSLLVLPGTTSMSFFAPFSGLFCFSPCIGTNKAIKRYCKLCICSTFNFNP